MIYLELFWSFVQIGLFSVGGGMAAMPLIQNQVVTIHGWLTLTEFTDLVTIAEMTPGPIAVNSATFVGIRIAGLPGAIAATALAPMPAIVADLGTATTFTAQDKGGSILGVAIAPGMAMGLEALAGRASQLFSVAIQGPKAAIGTNTVASLQSGVVLGAAALLDGMTDRMEEELNGEATLVVTGGLAPVVLPYCRRKAIHAPDLVLEGLYRYWQLNR